MHRRPGLELAEAESVLGESIRNSNREVESLKERVMETGRITDNAREGMEAAHAKWKAGR